MATNVLGVLSIIVYYIVIMVVGVWISKSQSMGDDRRSTINMILADRQVGLIIGMFTMTATWIGGSFINGIPEVVNGSGLLWAQSSWGYSFSLLLGGLFFSRIMRNRGYVTLLDPFQEHYGRRIGGIMYIPAFLGDLLWSAATLNSLGATIRVMLSLEVNISVIVAAFISLSYTFIGGLWPVAYVDMVQLLFILIGMWLTVPFAISHKAVSNIGSTIHEWKGVIHPEDSGVWLDQAFQMMFGGIPWQVYFQRVLSSKSSRRAQYLSYASGFGCLFMAAPSIVIGAVAFSTDWELTAFAEIAERKNGSIHFSKSETMPMVLKYLTPNSVSIIGLGAISAAAMSSVDSSVLSASSMFAYNIYKNIFRQKATDREIVVVLRISILLVGSLATTIGLTLNTIQGLAVLCSDLIYVMLFPQLVCVLYFRYANGYGVLISLVTGMILRISGGEPMLGIEAFLQYPFFDAERNLQLFPFRTFSMLMTIVSLWISSILIHLLFQKGIIPRRYDVANVFANGIQDFKFRKMFSCHGVEMPVEFHSNGRCDETKLTPRTSADDNEVIDLSFRSTIEVESEEQS